jgi:site-specific recombinase XerD
VLLAGLRRLPRSLGNPLVFSGPEGTAYKNVHSITTALNKAARRAGIASGVTFYPLRHAFCSHAMMQGIDPRTIQEWMGHKDLRTTLRYAHTSAEHKRAAMKQFRYQSSH